MSFTSIIGQPLALELVQRWLARQTTQPLLFHGPEGVGKRALALELAKALNCALTLAPSPAFRVGEGGGEGIPYEPCDQCLSCRKIAAGNHPDVRALDLAYQAAEREEEMEEQKSLRISTLLTERRRLLQSAGEGRWKVSILDDAHLVTADAANVFLKILEEPPERTAFVLITPYRDRLYQTILSRCQPVRFRPLTFDEMGRCLSRLKVPADFQARLIELARGSPGAATHLNREEQTQAAREADQMWESLPSRTPSAVLPGARLQGRSGRAEIEKRLFHLAPVALRDLYAGRAGAAESLELIQKALSRLRRSVQPGLVYDHLLLQLARRRKP